MIGLPWWYLTLYVACVLGLAALIRDMWLVHKHGIRNAVHQAAYQARLIERDHRATADVYWSDWATRTEHAMLAEALGRERIARWARDLADRIREENETIVHLADRIGSAV